MEEKRPGGRKCQKKDRNKVDSTVKREGGNWPGEGNMGGSFDRCGDRRRAEPRVSGAQEREGKVKGGGKLQDCVKKKKKNNATW